MTNFEKYKDEIIAFVTSLESDEKGERTFAVLKKEKDGKKIVGCNECDCIDCIFYNSNHYDECDCLDCVLKWICEDPELILTAKELLFFDYFTYIFKNFGDMCIFRDQTGSLFLGIYECESHSIKTICQLKNYDMFYFIRYNDNKIWTIEDLLKLPKA